jgi:hypothetical protein
MKKPSSEMKSKKRSRSGDIKKKDGEVESKEDEKARERTATLEGYSYCSVLPSESRIPLPPSRYSEFGSEDPPIVICVIICKLTVHRVSTHFKSYGV